MLVNGTSALASPRLCPEHPPRHFPTLDTGIATTGTVRASCAIWRETVGISANR
jgi:hypothetical protein